MADKVSKKDQDPNQVDKDREALLNMAKTSAHFTPGTFVLMNNRRGEILRETTRRDNSGVRLLRVRWSDGTMSTIEPIALNR